jgi:hypothetical protein
MQKKVGLTVSKQTYDEIMAVMDEAEERGVDCTEARYDLEKEFLRQF